MLYNVKEVTLYGTANLSFWEAVLHKEGLFPYHEADKAVLLISAMDAKWRGFKFKEFVIAVGVCLNENGTSLDGYFLPHAFNRPIPKTYKAHPKDTALISEKVRPLTTLERSYLQTFPKDFHFTGSKTDLEQMIGNAVPVKQAEYIARCINTYVSEKEDPLDPIDQQSVQLLLFRESK